MTIQGARGMFGSSCLFMSVEGEAEIILDKATLEAHWTSEPDRWRKDGPASPGVAMIKVHATRIHYWNGKEEGEVKI